MSILLFGSAIPLVFAGPAGWVVLAVGTGIWVYSTMVDPSIGDAVRQKVAEKVDQLPRWKEAEDERITPRKKLAPMRRALEPMLDQVPTAPPPPAVKPQKGKKPAPKRGGDNKKKVATNSKVKPRKAVEDKENTNVDSEIEKIRKREKLKKQIIDEGKKIIPSPFPDPDPDPDLDIIDNAQLKSLSNSPQPDIDPNDDPTPTKRTKWIVINQPSLDTPVGQIYVPPVIDDTVQLYTAPVTSGDSTIFDPTELHSAIIAASTAETYADYLFRASQGGVVGSYEEELDMTDVAIAFFPSMFIQGAPLEPVVGLKSLYRIAEAFSNYSDAALTAPIFNVPTKWNIEIIDGINEDQSQLVKPFIKEYLKPEDPDFQTKIKDSVLIADGQEVELDPDKLMTWLGNISLFEGGEAEQEASKNYGTIDDFLASDYLKNPDINEIINGEYDPLITNLPKLRDKSDVVKLKLKSQNDLTQQMLGIMSVKIGLDQFPSKMPSLQEPDFDLDSEDKRINIVPKPEVIVPSLAGGLALGVAGLAKNIGRFPLEMEIDGIEDVADPNNPKVTQKKKSHTYLPNMAHGIQEVATIAMATAGMVNFNQDLGLKNTKALEETKTAALKGMECSCGMLGNSGFNQNPKQRCRKPSFNFRNAKGFADMLNPQNDQCYVGTDVEDPVTIKKMLSDILFGVNLVKGAFFKGNKELDAQFESIKEINDEIKKKDKNFDKFVEDFNEQKTPLSDKDNYPVKSKIVVTDIPPKPPTP